MVLGDVLRSMGSFAGKEWVQNLDMAEFAINGSESSATGLTAFCTNFSREPRVPANLGKPNLDVPAAEELADAMFATITHTRDTLERAKRKYEKDNAGTRWPAEVLKKVTRCSFLPKSQLEGNGTKADIKVHWAF